jgi:hypothetical protein
MPSPLPRQVRWSLFARLSPSTAAFPVKKSGRLLQLFFRGLLSVHSRYGLHARRVAMRPSTPKAPTGLLPPPPLRLLPGGANQFPGGSCTRWSPAPFTAHCYAIYEVVGRVKRKMKHTSSLWVERGCQGRPFFGRSSRPLTAPPTPDNGARNEAKRSSVELRSMAEGFGLLLASSRKPDERQTCGQNCKITLSLYF